MYVPPAFREDSLSETHATIRASRLATLVTHGASGLIATPLPLFLDPDEGPLGTLYGHLAKANPQARDSGAEALAMFQGPEAYVSPSWYATKAETGKVVPTWNYVAVHAYGPAEFFDGHDRLLEVVTRLTDIYEGGRAHPWAVSHAPAEYVAAHLKGVVGLRLPIARFDAKRKMSQNRSDADRAGVASGLAASERPDDREVAKLIPV